MTANPNHAGISPAAQPAGAARKARRVLAIDDSPEIRMIIGETLDLFGFEAIVAEDGDRGIQLSREQTPDLIICDINMPGLDGYGTLKAMREHPATATIPRRRFAPQLRTRHALRKTTGPIERSVDRSSLHVTVRWKIK